MIRTKPKEKSQGLKKSPLKRKTPLKRKPFKKKPPARKIYNPVTKNSYPVKPVTKSNIKIESLWDKGLKKSKGKGLRIRIDPLDELFSRYIRLRDNYTCQRCGVKSKNVQCAHFIGRRNKNCRFNEKNATTLCMGCHQYFHANPLEFVEWTKKRLGEKDFEFLQAQERIILKPDKKLLTMYFQNKIKELEKLENTT